MRRLTGYNSDGVLIAAFPGREAINSEVSFNFDQRFDLPEVSIYSQSGEISKVNFTVAKLSPYSIKITFNLELNEDEEYTIKIK